ncbi:MAG: hypothetical protein FWF46_02865 [Oscillospiraceae bacterium]|nr:hypothetical protein [Oscillospiraceae bacterium]
MNQILSMNQQNPNFGSNYNAGGNGKRPKNSKAVKRIFIVLLIVLICILCIGLGTGLLNKSRPSGAIESEAIEDVNNIVAQQNESGDNTIASEDSTQPVIELTQQGSKLLVTAKTTTGTKLSYMMYKWDAGDETRIDATDDQTTIETTTSVSEGSHTITVMAVNENGVEANRQQTIIGIKKPKISVTKNGDYLVVSLTDDKAIVSANIMLNNKPIVLTEDRFGVPKIEFMIPMYSGANVLTITVTNQDGATETFNGQAIKSS